MTDIFHQSENDIPNSDDIQRAYRAVYTQMRNYHWTLPVCEKLANVEVAAFDSFVDVENLKRLVKDLRSAVSGNFKDDEELEKAFDDFDEAIDSVDPETQYIPLPMLTTETGDDETVEDNIAEAEELEEEPIEETEETQEEEFENEDTEENS